MHKGIHWMGLLLISTLVLAGCTAGGMKTVEKSGFLRDYSGMKPGGEDRAALLYIKPDANFRQYNKLMFDRVMVVFADNAEYREIDPAVLKELTDYYQNALFTAVKGGYEIVDQPGPGVMRVRTAITGVQPSKPVANTLSTIIPVGMVVSATTKIVSDDNLGTGEASTEFELVDSQSGARLAAAVDRRQGGKMIFRGKWTDTKEAFDFWATRFRQRLDEVRGAK